MLGFGRSTGEGATIYSIFKLSFGCNDHEGCGNPLQIPKGGLSTSDSFSFPGLRIMQEPDEETSGSESSHTVRSLLRALYGTKGFLSDMFGPEGRVS